MSLVMHPTLPFYSDCLKVGLHYQSVCDHSRNFALVNSKFHVTHVPQSVAKLAITTGYFNDLHYSNLYKCILFN